VKIHARALAVSYFQRAMRIQV